MKRSHRRWLAFLQASARRLAAQVKGALLTDTDVTVETGEADRARARELVRTAGELRGGMAKLAQLEAYLEGSSGTTDREARSVLATLWDHVPGDEPAAIRAVVAADLGAPVEEHFAAWDDRPLAAASLGQVHAAASRDGTRYAVKVQYPGVAEALRDDLDSSRIVRLLAGADVGGGLAPETLALLRESILAELDYEAEARHLERFRLAFAGDSAIRIPRVYPALSSRRVLTMERIDGRPLLEIAAGGTDEERAAVARTLVRFAWGAPLLHGLLNADPNPGNYLVLDEPSAAGYAKVGFLDFGCAAELDPALHEADHQLWMALLRRDGEMLRHAVYRSGLLADVKVLDSNAFRAWEAHLGAPFLATGDYHLTGEHVRELGRLTSALVRTRGLHIPPAALLLWRQRLGVLSVIAGLASRLSFRTALADVLDDHHHPVPLLQRYP